jgi:hypothetical protein
VRVKTPRPAPVKNAPMPGTRYEIVVKGQLSERFLSTFDSLALTAHAGHTRLSGELADQAQLYGVLLRLRDLGIELVSVNRGTG